MIILVFRRVNDKEEKVGKGGFTNTFLLVILCVVILSGGLTQFARLAELTKTAYLIYFIHLSAVFCLIFYAPYSKLAHVFYRTLAIVFARSIGRTRKVLPVKKRDTKFLRYQ